MSGTGASLNDKIDLAPWGYAPGDQLVTCTDCAKAEPLDSLHFLHRHATRCATHALAARQLEMRAYEGDLVPDPDREFELAVYAVAKEATDRFVRRAFIGAILLGSVVTGFVIFH